MENDASETVPDDEKHIIKYRWRDGKQLVYPESWCGIDMKHLYQWGFEDAHHALLSIDQGRTTQPCYNCMVAIGKVYFRFCDEIGLHIDTPPDPREEA